MKFELSADKMESNMALNFFKGIQLWHTEFESKQTLIVHDLIGENWLQFQIRKMQCKSQMCVFDFKSGQVNKLRGCMELNSSNMAH